MIKVNKHFIIYFLFFPLIVSGHSYAMNSVHRPDITKDAEIVSVRGDSWVRFIREKDWYAKVVFKL